MDKKLKRRPTPDELEDVDRDDDGDVEDQEVKLVIKRKKKDGEESRDGPKPDDENYHDGPNAETGSPRSRLEFEPKLEGLFQRLRRALFDGH